MNGGIQELIGSPNIAEVHFFAKEPIPLDVWNLWKIHGTWTIHGMCTSKVSSGNITLPSLQSGEVLTGAFTRRRVYLLAQVLSKKSIVSRQDSLLRCEHSIADQSGTAWSHRHFSHFWCLDDSCLSRVVSSVTWVQGSDIKTIGQHDVSICHSSLRMACDKLHCCVFLAKTTQTNSCL